MRIYVVAGTYVQAQNWAHDQGLSPREWTYVDDVSRLYGTENPKVVRVGTWWERDDIGRIDIEVRLRHRGGQ